MAEYNFNGLSVTSNNNDYTVSIVWCGNEKRCGKDYNPIGEILYEENHDRVQSAIEYGKYLITNQLVKIDDSGNLSYPMNVTDADIILKVEKTRDTTDYPKYYTIRRDAPDRLFATYNPNPITGNATSILTIKSDNLQDGLVTSVWNKEICITGDTEIGQNGIFSVTSNKGVKNAFIFPSGATCNAAFALKSSTDIGKEIFQWNKNIKTVRIPSNIEIIDSYAFNDCSALIEYSPSIFIKQIGDNAFQDCSSLKEARLGGNLTTLGTNAFASCGSLTDIVFENAENSTSMPNISGNGLTYIPQSCFQGCTSLSGTTYKYYNDGCSASTKYECIRIPENINQIGNFAFQNCTNITGVTFPTSAFTIGNSAFSGCTSLSEVNNLQYATSIGQNAFDKNILTGPINISGTSGISDSAFIGCTDITEVTFPTSSFTIGKNAFSGCTSITALTNLEYATSIGEGAFLNCRGITDVTINILSSSENSNIFSGCISISSVTFGENISAVTSGENLTALKIDFKDSHLKKVTLFYNGIVQGLYEIFPKGSESEKINFYVPIGFKNRYENDYDDGAYNWIFNGLT